MGKLLFLLHTKKPTKKQIFMIREVTSGVPIFSPCDESKMKFRLKEANINKGNEKNNVLVFTCFLGSSKNGPLW